MDLEGYWQENKGFVARVGLGAAALGLGVLVVDALWAADVAREATRVRRLERELGEAMYGTAERDQVAREHDALRACVERLRAAVAFEPRPELAAGDESVPPANRYLRVSSEVRERVLTEAGRANVSVEPGLGMPRLSPTSREEIERYLEALDVVETVAQAAIAARARRVEGIQVRLDPDPAARAAEGAIERTQVRFQILGSSRALTAVLGATQRPADGRVLRIAQAEIGAARGRDRELRLDLTIVIPRLPAQTREESG